MFCKKPFSEHHLNACAVILDNICAAGKTFCLSESCTVKWLISL